MLNISIVLYNNTFSSIRLLLENLLTSMYVRHIYLLDNSHFPLTERFPDSRVSYVHCHGKNLGYGRAHNYAFRRSIEDNIPLHLVMNSDISLRSEDIDTMYHYMVSHPDVGCLQPNILNPDGSQQYFPRLLPSPFNLFVRRFLPRKVSDYLNRHYELRDVNHGHYIVNVPALSGCFMLLRTDAIRSIGGFDKRFFLYFEDVDLCRRLQEHYTTLFFPECTITHTHAMSSYKHLDMLFVHLCSAAQYFQKYGWFFDRNRQVINRQFYELFE